MVAEDVWEVFKQPLIAMSTLCQNFVSYMYYYNYSNIYVTEGTLISLYICNCLHLFIMATIAFINYNVKSTELLFNGSVNIEIFSYYISINSSIYPYESNSPIRHSIIHQRHPFSNLVKLGVLLYPSQYLRLIFVHTSHQGADTLKYHLLVYRGVTSLPSFQTLLHPCRHTFSHMIHSQKGGHTHISLLLYYIYKL